MTLRAQKTKSACHADAPGSITFGPFRLDVEAECLERDGQQIPLTPKVFSLLRHLVENAGQLLTKEDLLNAVWPDVTVGDAVLKVCIGEVRKALGDDAASPRFVATMHRRGYRFVAPTARGRRSGTAVLSAPILVGRAGVLAGLEGAHRQAAAGDRQTIFISGEPGIGKTAVVETFRARLADDPGVWCADGQCFEHYGAGEPYLPFLDGLNRLCRTDSSGEVERALRRCAPTWRMQMPWLDATNKGNEPPPSEVSRERMMREMAELVVELAARKTLVLVLEDLQWCDYSTLDLLAFLARDTAGANFVMIVTYRPVEVVIANHPLRAVTQELVRNGRAQEIALELLNHAEVGEYLESRLEGSAGEDLISFVLARSHGNPLFLVNLVDYLLADDRLENGPDGWVLPPKVDIDLPEGVRQVIEKQLGRLSDAQQRLLEAASVAGVEFLASAVATALEGERVHVEEVCDSLVERGFALAPGGLKNWPDGSVDARYEFTHSLFQQVLYDRIPEGRRVRWHRAVGRYLAAAHGDGAEELAAELAMHFERGREFGRAVSFLRQAAERAAHKHAYQEAIDHLNRGLDLLPELPEESRQEQELLLQTALGPLLMVARGFSTPEVEQCQTRARALCEKLGANAQLFQALRGLSIVYLAGGEHETGYAVAEQCLALAQSTKDAAMLLRAHMMLGIGTFYMGRLREAREHFETALTHGDPSRRRAHGAVPVPEVTSLSFLSHTLWIMGFPDQALERSQEALAIAHELDHPDSLFWALHLACELHTFRGERANAEKTGLAAARLADEQSFNQFVAWGQFFRGSLLARQGKKEGAALMRQGRSDYLATGAEGGRTQLAAMFVEWCAGLAKSSEMIEILDEELRFASRRRERYFEPELHRLKGELMLTSRRPKRRARTAEGETGVSAEFHMAIEEARRQGARSWELRAATSLAKLLQDQGRAEEGDRVLRPVYDWFREGVVTHDLEEGRRVLESLASR